MLLPACSSTTGDVPEEFGDFTGQVNGDFERALSGIAQHGILDDPRQPFSEWGLSLLQGTAVLDEFDQITILRNAIITTPEPGTYPIVSGLEPGTDGDTFFVVYDTGRADGRWTRFVSTVGGTLTIEAGPGDRVNGRFTFEAVANGDGIGEPLGGRIMVEGEFSATRNLIF